MRIIVLTGAGISAESGLATFRGPGGLWEGHLAADLATPEAFARDPATVHRFYDMRRAHARAAKPNAAHKALVKLAQTHDVTLVTQNVDDLHERAGLTNVIHMHGELESALCAACGNRWAAGDTLTGVSCPACGTGTARPDIVWFGEQPYHLDRIGRALASCDMFVAIGTSGQVYPAAGFVGLTPRKAHRVELNLDRSTISAHFDEHRLGPATETVPLWVSELRDQPAQATSTL